jgi:hypothetical protein
MLTEVSQMLQKHAPDHVSTTRLKEFISDENTSDEKIMRVMQKHLVPNGHMIQSRDIESLHDEYPDLELKSLAAALSKDDAGTLWGHLSMLIMLTTTLSMIPPQMLQQIEGFAKTMAATMQGGGSGGLGLDALSNMFDPTPVQSPRNTSRSESRSGGGSRKKKNRNKEAQVGSEQSEEQQQQPLTRQEEFRAKLV